MRRERITSIELQDVSHGFEAGKNVLEKINFKFEFGKVIVFQGAPGTGKSLLLKVSAGLVEPNQGNVIYNQKPLKELSFEEFAPMRTSTSVCFENGGLLMNKTLSENIQLGLRYNHQWRHERSGDTLKKLIDDFGIGASMHLRPSSVSASVRKIAGLIRTFVSTPQVILFDEPSLGLGDNGVSALKYWIEKYRQDGKEDELIVIASSDTRFIELFDAQKYFLSNGLLDVSKDHKKGQAA
jgi:ABC-type transporter Mla maintaining outer membrane lipid asymmetry ATPase subunit MlaF